MYDAPKKNSDTTNWKAECNNCLDLQQTEKVEWIDSPEEGTRWRLLPAHIVEAGTRTTWLRHVAFTEPSRISSPVSSDLAAPAPLIIVWLALVTPSPCWSSQTERREGEKRISGDELRPR